jgi:hypothetical protein
MGEDESRQAEAIRPDESSGRTAERERQAGTSKKQNEE